MNPVNGRRAAVALLCLAVGGVVAAVVNPDPKNVANRETKFSAPPAPLPGEPTATLFVHSDWGWMNAGGGQLRYCVRPRVQVQAMAASATRRNPTQLQAQVNWTKPITFTLLDAQQQQVANAAPWVVPMPIEPGQTVEMPAGWCPIVQSPQGPPTLFLQVVGGATEPVQFNVPQRPQRPPKRSE